LNLNKEANWQVRDNDKNETNEEGKGIMKTEPSPLQKYCNRPTELEELSLFRLYLQYKLVKGIWDKCNNENIVRVWPRPSPIRDGPQWEEFCRIKVLLHVRYRDLISLTENHTLSWIKVYNQHIAEITDDPEDIIRPAVDNIEDDKGNDSEDEEITQEAYEHRTDWMVLAEMMPNRQTCSLDDFSIRILIEIMIGLMKVSCDIQKLKRQKASFRGQLATGK
jgi:hypothetical protein